MLTFKFVNLIFPNYCQFPSPFKRYLFLSVAEIELSLYGKLVEVVFIMPLASVANKEFGASYVSIFAIRSFAQFISPIKVLSSRESATDNPIPINRFINANEPKIVVAGPSISSAATASNPVEYLPAGFITLYILLNCNNG
jgi:hypothetical protein